MNLEMLKNKTILFLGKPRAFSQTEFDAQLQVHGIEAIRELREGVDVVLEGRMMSPYEQNLSDELYEKGGYTFITIDAFEQMLAQEIDDDVLLMSLKLSNDKERLKSFLQNSCVSDRLFFKLLQMYRWGGEDFFENDDNRDVTAALIGRFYENIERNHNVQYATTGLIHLLSQTKSAELLEAVSQLEPLRLHPKLSVLLARHPKTPKKVLQRLLREGDERVLEAMCSNSALDKELIKALAKNEKYAKILAQTVVLDKESFQLFLPFAGELARNESLTTEMQKRVFDLKQSSVWYALAQNRALTESNIQKLLETADEKLKELLLQNPNIDERYLREAANESRYHQAIAKNPSLPEDLALQLFEGGGEDVLKALAANEATPVDILYQLQLDSRFERAVKTNASFGKHIQSENIGWLV